MVGGTNREQLNTVSRHEEAFSSKRNKGRQLRPCPLVSAYRDPRSRQMPADQRALAERVRQRSLIRGPTASQPGPSRTRIGAPLRTREEYVDRINAWPTWYARFVNTISAIVCSTAPLTIAWWSGDRGIDVSACSGGHAWSPPLSCCYAWLVRIVQMAYSPAWPGLICGPVGEVSVPKGPSRRKLSESAVVNRAEGRQVWLGVGGAVVRSWRGCRGRAGTGRRRRG